MKGNPTTIRLEKYEQDRLKKLAVLYGNQSTAISKALALLWAEYGEQAEQAWTLVQATREEPIDWRMTTEDRMSQIFYLRELADNLARIGQVQKNGLSDHPHTRGC